MTIKHAYATLEIKAGEATDGKRTFTGTASTPSVDSQQDIVEPLGAEFDLPLPLCWMHNARDPVGWVTAAKVSAKGIVIEGEVASINEPPTLKERLDTAWAMLRGKLVRGLSIGFLPLESARLEGTYGFRHIRWKWVELSPVVIASNSDCSIMQIRSVDQAVIKAALRERGVYRLDSSAQAGVTKAPGASGPEKARRKGVIYLN